MAIHLDPYSARLPDPTCRYQLHHITTPFQLSTSTQSFLNIVLGTVVITIQHTYNLCSLAANLGPVTSRSQLSKAHYIVLSLIAMWSPNIYVGYDIG